MVDCINAVRNAQISGCWAGTRLVIDEGFNYTVVWTEAHHVQGEGQNDP